MLRRRVFQKISFCFLFVSVVLFCLFRCLMLLLLLLLLVSQCCIFGYNAYSASHCKTTTVLGEDTQEEHKRLRSFVLFFLRQLFFYFDFG